MVENLERQIQLQENLLENQIQRQRKLGNERPQIPDASPVEQSQTPSNCTAKAAAAARLLEANYRKIKNMQADIHNLTTDNERLLRGLMGVSS